MSLVVSGVLQGISDIRTLKEGVFKSGPRKGQAYTSYGVFLTVDGVSYSLTGFNRDVVVGAVKDCVEGKKIEFCYSVNGNYKNIDLKKGIDVFTNLGAQNLTSSKNTSLVNGGSDAHVSPGSKNATLGSPSFSGSERELSERLVLAVEKIADKLEALK